MKWLWGLAGAAWLLSCIALGGHVGYRQAYRPVTSGTQMFGGLEIWLENIAGAVVGAVIGGIIGAVVLWLAATFIASRSRAKM